MKDIIHNCWKTCCRGHGKRDISLCTLSLRHWCYSTCIMRVVNSVLSG